METKRALTLMSVANLLVILVSFTSLTSVALPSSPEDIAIQSIQAAAPGLVKLHTPPSDATPLILIQGLTFNEPAYTWAKPFKHLLALNRPLFFYKWSKFKSLQWNQKHLSADFIRLLADYKSLKVIGFSAGGAIALLSLDSLVGTSFYPRIHLQTIATPLFGYGAPQVAYLGAPIAGMSAIQIGISAYRFMQHTHLEGCQQWITTDCSLDPHACPHRGVFPQSGRTETEMPCGNENTRRLDHESHASALFSVIQRLFP